MSRRPTLPTAVVSVDMDPVDVHLAGYGVTAPPDAAIYKAALPRLLDAFDRAGLSATFFFIGREAGDHADSIALVARAGHEVASHSQTHPAPFASLDEERLLAEVADARRALETASGEAVWGFRAPNWDLGPRVVDALARAGYRYDASLCPTPLMVPARLLLALKSRDPRVALSLRLWPCAFQRLPYAHEPRGGSTTGIWEFPVTVSPRLRLPLYHTARYFASERRFLSRIEVIARRGEPFFYPLHAVDALGIAEDGVDPRLSRHPGMDWPLGRKLGLLDATLAAIGARFELSTYRQLLQ